MIFYNHTNSSIMIKTTLESYYVMMSDNLYNIKNLQEIPAVILPYHPQNFYLCNCKLRIEDSSKFSPHSFSLITCNAQQYLYICIGIQHTEKQDVPKWIFIISWDLFMTFGTVKCLYNHKIFPCTLAYILIIDAQSDETRGLRNLLLYS